MSFGSRQMDQSFDRWRTGNYGENQYSGEDEFFEFAEKTCVDCLCQCPIFERYKAGEDTFDDFMDRCLIIKGIMEQVCEHQMEKVYWDELGEA